MLQVFWYDFSPCDSSCRTDHKIRIFDMSVCGARNKSRTCRLRADRADRAVLSDSFRTETKRSKSSNISHRPARGTRVSWQYSIIRHFACRSPSSYMIARGLISQVWDLAFVVWSPCRDCGCSNVASVFPCVQTFCGKSDTHIGARCGSCGVCSCSMGHHSCNHIGCTSTASLLCVCACGSL